jgi:hypothetical protein
MRPWLALLALPAVALADPPASPLPDLEAGAVRGRCEVPPRTTAPAIGADQTFAGVFTVHEDGRVTGVERRLLFPNATWRATTAPDGTRGADCVIEWSVTGRRVPPARCTDCAFGIEFEASVDHARSTCPMRLRADSTHFRGAYDVKVGADGAIEVLFAASGNPLGTGVSAGGEHRWISPHRCVWL